MKGLRWFAADLVDHHKVGISVSPRTILKRQLERLDKAGMVAMCGTELEFIVFNNTYEEAWDKGYTDLTPANQYNVDYSLTGYCSRGEVAPCDPTWNGRAGLTVESAKGECNFGQHEIAFRYEDALATCDNHSIYKMGAKEIASQQGCALTFMAKFNEKEGSSCHIHLSFRDKDGGAVLAGDAGDGMSELGRHYLAGLQAHCANSHFSSRQISTAYKRYQPGTFAPTAIKWGRDNRTCALRLVGQGHSLRVENRVPGGDANPYLAVAGMVAAGLDGIEKKLPLEPIFTGNAYALRYLTCPNLSPRGSVICGRIVRGFAIPLVKMYRSITRIWPIQNSMPYSRAVTDWERFRGFERM
jgi:glutamine synthetase